MIRLPLSIRAWSRPDFESFLKTELESIPADKLPLQQALQHTSMVGSEPFQVMLLNNSDESDFIYVKTRVFYTGVVSGCHCADDPGPMEELQEQCELEFAINKRSGIASVRLLQD